jgi:hypothetical protein
LLGKGKDSKRMACIMHPQERQVYVYPEYFLGIDLGQRADHSAVAVVEEAVWVEDDWGLEFMISSGTGEERRLLTGWVSPDAMTHHQLLTAKRLNLTRGRPPNPPLRVRFIKRYPLQTPYHDVVDDIRSMLRRPPLSTTDVATVMDLGAAGTAVLEMFRQAGLSGVIPVFIHGGYATIYDEETGTFKVPKRDLVQSAQVLAQIPQENDKSKRKLEISPALPHARIVEEELRAFTGKVSEGGHDRYEGREREHDDLVLALSLATWYRTYMYRHVEASMAAHIRRWR